MRSRIVTSVLLVTAVACQSRGGRSAGEDPRLLPSMRAEPDSGMPHWAPDEVDGARAEVDGGVAPAIDGGAEPVDACAPTQTQCWDDDLADWACVDTSSDPSHCGACNEACDSGGTCRDGTCGCATGEAGCDGRCIDVQEDARNCGACGLTCLDTEACDAGRCRPAICPAGECDLLRDACPATESCYVSADGPVCAVTPRSSIWLLEGRGCSYVNDCAPGLSCLFGRCRRPCCEGSDASCGEDRYCIANSDWGSCMPDASCDTTDQWGCPSGEGCYLLQGVRICLESNHSRPEGAACTYIDDCAAGYTCIDDASGSGICRRYCDTADPHCPPSYECAPLAPRVPHEIGVCLPE